MLHKRLLSTVALGFMLLSGPAFAAGAADVRQEATASTMAANKAVLEALPFDDTGDFADASRGLIAPLPEGPLKNASGITVWDPAEFSFVKEGSKAPATVNPSLWRQSQLVNMAGLFEVTDGIYQVRNQDLSNMTIIEGEEGITIVDPLISSETAKAALDLYYKERGERPVKAVIYSHSHVDHYGGVRGVISEDDVKAGKVKIYAPAGFLDAAIAENVMAGNAMSRRASYMYGALLPADAKGQVGAGLGMTTSDGGEVTLIAPTDTISSDGQKEVIDGLTYDFMLAPGSEAPSEMLWYIEEKKAIEAAEDITHTLHNTYSLRGAKTRDPLAWSKYINAAKTRWGGEAEVMFAQHHWPTFGNENINKLLTSQRDLYRYINDQTLHLVNQGYTKREIAEQVALPPALADVWANRGYYGSLYHDVAATYDFYLGWFDGNPATLHELPPTEAAKNYVDYMGGAEAVLEKAQQSYEDGAYRWVAQVVNDVIFADPTNEKAKALQANALEQLGYQAESGPWRNFYLTGAQELRNGIADLPVANSVSPDTIRAMDPDMLFDYLAILIDAGKAGTASATYNVDFGGADGSYLLELSNGTLNHTAGVTAPDADVTVKLSRDTLSSLILKQETVDQAIEKGALSFDGDREAVKTLLGYVEVPDFWFNIVTP